MTAEDEIAQHFDRMRGRILGLIESWGLPAAQERGCKSIFKSLSYDAEADIKDLFEACRQEAQTAIYDAAGTSADLRN